jgi:hypothetical protein
VNNKKKTLLHTQASDRRPAKSGAVFFADPLATGAQRRESREARQRRDAGQPEHSAGNPEKRQRRDAGQPERSAGNPEKRQRRDAGQPETDSKPAIGTAGGQYRTDRKVITGTPSHGAFARSMHLTVSGSSAVS